MTFSTGQPQKKEEAQPRAGKSSIQGVRGIFQDFHIRKPRSAQSPTVAVAADQEALFQLVSTKSDSPTDKSGLGNQTSELPPLAFLFKPGRSTPWTFTHV